MWVQQEEGENTNRVGEVEEEGEEQCGCNRRRVKTLTVWARWKRRGKNNVGAAGGG